MTEETFQKKQSEIFDKYNIPEEFHDWLANIVVWEDCHPFGYEAVLDCLPEFIHRFNKALQLYTTRVVVDSFQDGYGEAMTDIDMGPL